jgi:hypothetical protein
VGIHLTNRVKRTYSMQHCDFKTSGVTLVLIMSLLVTFKFYVKFNKSVTNNSCLFSYCVDEQFFILTICIVTVVTFCSS